MYSPNESFELVVVGLDILLLLYFLYIGYVNRNLPTLALALAQLLPIGYYEYVAFGTHTTPTLLVDGISSIMSLIVSIVGSAVAIYALDYMVEHEEEVGSLGASSVKAASQGSFFFYLIMLLGAMHGVVFSNSLYWLYFFWEVTTLSCYQLIRHDGTEIAVQNGLRALWMGLVGGVALVGSIFIGHFHFDTISMSALIGKNPTPLLYLAFALMAIAAFTKSAQLPFQSWLLGAMVAPTPVSALLHSSTMVNAGVYLILRFVPAIEGSVLTYGIALVGIFTFMFTAIIALNQKYSKAILAYSTIGNLGLMIFCAAMNTPLSYSAAVILLIFHSMSKGLLFLCAGIVENRLHTRYIEEWQGLLGKLPLTSSVMITGIISMILPLFGVLLGKWAAIGAVSSAAFFPALVMITMMVIGSSATTLFWAKWLGNFTVLPLTEREYKFEQLPSGYIFSMFFLLSLDIVASLGVGLIIQNVVCPAIASNYACVWTAGILGISSQLGSFMIIPIWAAIAAVVLLGNYLYKSKGGIIMPAYLSGANVEGSPTSFRTTADTTVEFNVAGMFFDPEINEGRWTPWGVVTGVLMNLLVIALVVL
ncbi:MAG TPA: proton-conducting transporter membrane subunit [Patescibacteria group bacterium]|nr:proton-conducting transporter membrane subunit [Patescibacteria group bacterium]